jgi:mxaJ protein
VSFGAPRNPGLCLFGGDLLTLLTTLHATPQLALSNRALPALTAAAVALCLSQAAAEEANAPAANPAFVVCADPANPPYSNKAGEGFENKIAALIAADMRVELSYFWFVAHKSFLRRTLLDGLCDAVISLPLGLPSVETTRPYFTSSFVAVTRANDARRFTSFDDSWLREARIGLPLVGHEGATTPPALSLSARGINEHITPFPMWSEEGDADPQGKIIQAVADGSIDVAFVWGPFAGHFAKPFGEALRVAPIVGDPKNPELAFAFPMAIGVRKSNADFRDRLQEALDRHGPEIEAILHDAGVPMIAAASPNAADAAKTSLQVPTR